MHAREPSPRVHHQTAAFTKLVSFRLSLYLFTCGTRDDERGTGKEGISGGGRRRERLNEEENCPSGGCVPVTIGGDIFTFIYFHTHASKSPNLCKFKVALLPRAPFIFVFSDGDRKKFYGRQCTASPTLLA